MAEDFDVVVGGVVVVDIVVEVVVRKVKAVLHVLRRFALELKLSVPESKFTETDNQGKYQRRFALELKLSVPASKFTETDNQGKYQLCSE